MIIEKNIQQIDMHMHSIYSDGTDDIASLLRHVKEANMDLFSLTDHDCITGCEEMITLLKADDPLFVQGVEFSCKDTNGKYHILGYNFDMGKSEVRALTEVCHNLRIEKVENRLKFLETSYGFYFSEEEKMELFALSNPGKPHIANLMIKKGYVKTISEGIRGYISNYHGKERRISPKEAIQAIVESNGIAVLAHGLFGDGDQLLTYDEMKERVEYLIPMGIMGLECFYSGFSKKQEEFMKNLCAEKDLLITAGSDYHGKNKMIQLGDVSVSQMSETSPDFVGVLKKLDIPMSI